MGISTKDACGYIKVLILQPPAPDSDLIRDGRRESLGLVG